VRFSSNFLFFLLTSNEPIALTHFSEQDMEGRRTTSYPDLSSGSRSTGRDDRGGLHHSSLDLFTSPQPDRSIAGTNKDSGDDESGPPDDTDIAAGNVLLDYNSDTTGDAVHGSSTIEGLPAATINKTPQEPMNIDSVPFSVKSSNNSLDPLYYQCKSARQATFRDHLISVSADDTLGKKILAPSPVIGSFESVEGIEKTFHGSRILKGNVTVNQSISCSFDPSNFVCVSCDKNHKIFCVKPIPIIFADQNFIPVLPSNDGNCINIVRVENASLIELFDITKEMLENTPVTEGSVLLFGSLSHLARVGTSLYAVGWTELVAGASSRWRGARICPLIPVISDDCPGSLAREIVELKVWLETVYENSQLGLPDVWASLVASAEEFSAGASQYSYMDTYKIPLPRSLACQSLNMVATYCSVRSRPAILKGFPKDKQRDLLWSLLDCLCNSFHVCSSPEAYLERGSMASSKVETTPSEQKVVLIGASNLGYCRDHFRQSGLEVIDLTVPGWVASPENVSAVMANIKELDNASNHCMVIDPFSNSTFHFEQFDGSTSLPFKSGGKYHLAGDVSVCSLNAFQKQVEAIVPILAAKKESHCVLIPPLPRYLFTPCCANQQHCTNLSEDGYCDKIMSDLISVRLIKIVNDLGLKNIRVADSCPVIELTPADNIKSRLEKLRSVVATDGVHYKSTGYANIVKNCVTCFSVLDSRTVNSTTVKKSLTHYWRGFKSSVGASPPNVLPTSGHNRGRGVGPQYQRGGGRGRRPFHPYQK
jgi:hypothetical protein